MVEFVKKLEVNENSLGKLTMSSIDSIDFKNLFQIDLSPHFEKDQPCEEVLSNHYPSPYYLAIREVVSSQIIF